MVNEVYSKTGSSGPAETTGRSGGKLGLEK